MTTSGWVFDIQKFSLHDGPGIRTTVFLKGCPLRCPWCHNPESQDAEREISFDPAKCIGCGWCRKACPNNAHATQDGRHVLDRALCVRCGACARQCYAEAIEVIGRRMSVASVMAEVTKDLAFYQSSGGGLTLSGGEPMFQFDFTLAILQAAKRIPLHVCLQTSGFAPVAQMASTLPCVDLYLFDIKETDPARHATDIGVPLAPILKSLDALASHSAAIVLRCPIIPGLNDREDHFAGIGRLASRYESVSGIEIEPYHPLGLSKGARIGKRAPREGPGIFPPSDAIASWMAAIRKHTNKPVGTTQGLDQAEERST